MRILLASSEAYPFSKTGGLADMVGSLGKALAHAGHEAAIVTPLYRGILQRYPALKKVNWQFNLPLGIQWYQGGLYSMEMEPGLTFTKLAPHQMFRLGRTKKSNTQFFPKRHD